MVKDIINRVVLDSVNLVHVNLILGRAFCLSRGRDRTALEVSRPCLGPICLASTLMGRFCTMGIGIMLDVRYLVKKPAVHFSTENDLTGDVTIAGVDRSNRPWEGLSYLRILGN